MPKAARQPREPLKEGVGGIQEDRRVKAVVRDGHGGYAHVHFTLLSLGRAGYCSQLTQFPVAMDRTYILK